MPERVSALFAFDLVLPFLGEFFVGCADVGKVGISGTVCGDNVSEEERVRRTTRIERGVYMPECVALPFVSNSTSDLTD